MGFLSNYPIFRRKQFLINPKLQLTIALFVLGSSLLSSLSVCSLVYLNLEGANSLYAEQFPELRETLEHESKVALRSLFLFGTGAALLFATPLILLVILYTHRFTGPIYNATMFFRRVSENPDVYFSKERPLTFRKHDYFKEFAEAVNEAAEALQPRGDKGMVEGGGQESSGDIPGVD